LQNSVLLEVEGGDKIQIAIEYEWVPPTCTKCSCFGHVESQCPTVAVWKLREKEILADHGPNYTHSHIFDRVLARNVAPLEICAQAATDDSLHSRVNLPGSNATTCVNIDTRVPHRSNVTEQIGSRTLRQNMSYNDQSIIARGIPNLDSVESGCDNINIHTNTALLRDPESLELSTVVVADRNSHGISHGVSEHAGNRDAFEPGKSPNADIENRQGHYSDMHKTSELGRSSSIVSDKIAQEISSNVNDPSFVLKDSLPDKLTEVYPEWLKEMESCAKTSSAAVKGKKQVQIPSDGPKRSLRVNKGLHPGTQCQ